MGNYAVYWHLDNCLWGLDGSIPNDCWFGFGTNDPQDERSFCDIVIQFGFWPPGALRTKGMTFARDDDGAIYVTHSGKIGGGRPGIGREAFLDWYFGRQSNRVNYVNWPKGVKSECIVIGAIEDGDFLQNVAAFVGSVASFKAEASAAGG